MSADLTHTQIENVVRTSWGRGSGYFDVASSRYGTSRRRAPGCLDCGPFELAAIRNPTGPRSLVADHRKAQGD